MTAELLSVTYRQRERSVFMAIEYPLNKIRTPLGTVADPTISIEVLTMSGYRLFDFLLDTGADCTILPKFMAGLLEIDLSACKRARSYGVEGKGVTVYIEKIDIKIDKYPLKIKCLFSEEETTPFILGRMGIFSKFNIIFDNKRKRIRLTRI